MAPLESARRVLTEAGVPHTELRGVRAGDEVVLLLFTLTSLAKARVLETLANHGLGCTTPAHGRLEVLEVLSSTPYARRGGSGPRRRRVRVSDRTSLDEIYQRIDETFHFTFDFVLTTAIASTVCAVGLATDQPIFVTASMLLSPLMAPIMAQTLGTCVGDKRMVYKGCRNECAGLLLCLLVGSLVGGVCIASGSLADPHEEDPTLEVLHYKQADLLVGALIALPSGAALALAVTSALSDTVVGVAIATSILPPVVGSGINLVLSARAALSQDQEMAASKLRAAMLGVAMVVINWLCIFLGCGLLLRLKQVDGLLQRAQQGAKSPPRRRAPLDPQAPPQAANELERRLLSAAAAGAGAGDSGARTEEQQPEPSGPEPTPSSSVGVGEPGTVSSTSECHVARAPDTPAGEK
ncbi:hypothetical protein EMIHUDRAFT_461978 [Emiliania huxleyi CCMP1516]|uniref:DUF389 domain-containing protein n=2 Tax=Emiliania huxleyi TaxID=2903 RepID=A0A0D3I279_EMIH1|nr:hypothetical protein EMIHUDRAFT_461978 [Emiliania huxleyi CCMP1516]EOD05364.1 hypothetical protein EMIHUDRAFT_461978 [Emiliania huxleyi CCMP1516]|eukprot:XP_005757793.1 hypothetical protein EMIHUDRAFT_461978 [Emiliania huxleyi CCMP1516]